MTFCLVKGNVRKKNKPTYVEVETVNQRNLENLKSELTKKNIYAKLDTNMMSDPNNNCNIMMGIITDAKKMHIPKENKKI